MALGPARPSAETFLRDFCSEGLGTCKGTESRFLLHMSKPPGPYQGAFLWTPALSIKNAPQSSGDLRGDPAVGRCRESGLGEHSCAKATGENVACRLASWNKPGAVPGQGQFLR